MYRSIILFAAVLVLVLSACTTTESEATRTPSAPTSEPTMAPTAGGEATATPATPDTAECPATSDDTWLLRNARHGYCLLYPTAYKVEKPNAIETVLVIGGLLNAQDTRLSITVEEASGRTAEEVANQVTADWQGFDIEQSALKVAGEDAIVLDNLPGQDINRQVLFVHEGRLYRLTFTPADAALGDAYERMTALYDMALASFSFIPVSDAAVPGEDCLEAKPDMQPFVSETQGYCLLLPSGYSAEEPSENETAIFTGSLMDVEHARAFIEVQDAAGRTAQQAAEELAADAEAALPGYSVERSFGWTVGYEPAWALENMPGQEISRQVLAVHDGRLYKLTFVPANEDAGERYTQMQSLFTMVINSFRFLR